MWVLKQLDVACMFGHVATLIGAHVHGLKTSPLRADRGRWGSYFVLKRHDYLRYVVIVFCPFFTLVVGLLLRDLFFMWRNAEWLSGESFTQHTKEVFHRTHV